MGEAPSSIATEGFDILHSDQSLRELPRTVNYFAEPWNPQPDEIRAWAYDADAMWPDQDFDLALSLPENGSLYCELAADDFCPKRDLFLKVLYLMVGDAVRTNFRPETKTTLQTLVEQGDKHDHSDIRIWQKRCRTLLDESHAVDYVLWCDGGYVRIDAAMERLHGNRTLEELEGEVWEEPGYNSLLVLESHRLRKVPLREWRLEDFRRIIGQQFSLQHVLPVALEYLRVNPLIEGDCYRGDILRNLMKVDPAFWGDHPDLRKEVESIVEQAFSMLEISEDYADVERDALKEALPHFQKSSSS